MAEIGRKGGEVVSPGTESIWPRLAVKAGESASHDTEHMSEIGRNGGEHSHGGTSEERSRASGSRSYKSGKP